MSTTHLSSLPNELLLRLLKLLPIVSSLHLSLTCSRLYNLCRPELEKGLDVLRQESSRIVIDPEDENNPWQLHKMLSKIQNLELPPSLIKRLLAWGLIDCHSKRWSWSTEREQRIERFGLPPYKYCEPREPARLTGREIFQNLSDRHNPRVVDPDQLWPDILAGSTSAVLAVLLPLLTHLEYLVLDDYWDEWLNASFYNMAWLQQGYLDISLSSSSPGFTTKPPLFRLRAIYFSCDMSEIGAALWETFPFINLPFLEYCNISGCHDSEFSLEDARADKVPRPRLQRVDFLCSTVMRRAIEEYVKLWNSSVVMVLIHWDVGNQDDRKQDWNYLTVSGEVDPKTGLFREGTRRVTVDLREEEDLPEIFLWNW